ncbi:hypothetical protein [Dorea sp. D27]|uniref:hypothetical protein n=1 Tax=Dorea sp. D27 TaxID=658665 RepID=UPI000A66A108|nr:hypothetical protein [Dorea sp. D27]
MYQPKLKKKRNGIPVMSKSEMDAHAERVPVYLLKERCADYLYAKRGTLLIDNTLLSE